MNFAPELVIDALKHRGCGVRPASYEIAPQVWLPEACIWLPTDTGMRRVWVHSFAHCFDADKLTFANKFEADDWALVAARAIVDRALDTPEMAPVFALKTRGSFSARWQFARCCALALFGLKLFR
jgi:hypothetical protein